MKKICIVTATRAEYGLLKPVIEKIYKSETTELKLVVTGMHLSPEFGLTYKEIEADGYPIDQKIEMLLSSDTPVGITKSMGIALIGFGDYFSVNRPDIVVILGDRYEMLMVAAAAMIARIPIAHLHGGEKTEGAVDEAIRHSITKMSHLHFTSTEEYRRRVIQLGEQPDRVYNVGALGVENARKVSLLRKEELENQIGFHFSEPTVMVTYHPVTLEMLTAKDQFTDILSVIDSHKEISVIFTKANADTDGRIINRMIDEYVRDNSDRCAVYTSLGQRRYLSALQYVDAVLGNSSSGLVEVPSFHIPTINIGDRQRGRVCAESVIHCGNSANEIESALLLALSKEFRQKLTDMDNPYEREGTSDKIVETICDALEQGIEIKKSFYDIV
ncbi:MAG: UDP-N-acetylglucosamine 2-epimerase (hydrolyzing) [Lachnospiraceae bacterium]|nr:UDP-N-acetylglucosamine 2-epimerase (hydrolyzing) [Lachnospiraceae bacterium]